MTVKRDYFCNMCRESIKHDPYEGFRGFGLWWAFDKWELKIYHEAENHLCRRCMTSIQSLPKRCIAGFECNGGLKCGSDHK
jgi:hypothetical protein